ncbi:MAG: TolC family protein, partial [Pseudomonadota bacterium]|nr:TolC family protein [Pseudomonadota bacterium]
MAVPAKWSVTAATAPVTPLALWWRRFDDPLLSALVDEALAHNRSIAGARAALAQARALADVQAADRWPVLGANASAQRTRTHADSTNNFVAGFDASWELDVFGGQRAAVRAADANIVAAGASLADVQVSVAAEVALDYLSLRCLQTRLAIARAGLSSQQDTLQLTSWRVQSGQITVLELDQARTAVEQTRAQIPAFQSTLAQTESSLSVLTGQAPGVLRPRLAGAGASCDRPAIPMPVPAIPAATLRQRPDVRAAE